MQPDDVGRDRPQLDRNPSPAIVLRLDLEAVRAPADVQNSLDSPGIAGLKVRSRSRRLGGSGYQPRAIHSSRCGRSRPIVVGLPCPGRTSISSARVKSLLLMLSTIVGKLA